MDVFTCFDPVGLVEYGMAYCTLRLNLDGSLVLARDLWLLRVGINWMMLVYVSGLSMATPYEIARAGPLMGCDRRLGCVVMLRLVLRVSNL